MGVPRKFKNRHDGKYEIILHTLCVKTQKVPGKLLSHQVLACCTTAYLTSILLSCVP